MATNVGGLRRGAARRHLRPSPWWSAAAAQYAIRAVRDRFLAERQPVRLGGLLLRFARASASSGSVAPTMQVYGNASHAYEPPLLLELTAPGQLSGNLGQLAAQKAWQFEVGTRGNAGERVALGRVRLRHRALGRDPERQRPAVPGRAVHDPALPQHRPLAPHRRGGRGRRAARGGHRCRGWGSAAPATRSARAPRIPGRASSSWTTSNFGNNDLPGAPRHFVPAELRYDHGSGFWVAPGVEVVPQGYFVNSENDARNDRLHARQRPHGLRATSRGTSASSSRPATWPTRTTSRRSRSTTRTGASSSRATAARSTAASPGGGDEHETARARRSRSSSRPRRSRTRRT